MKRVNLIVVGLLISASGFGQTQITTAQELAAFNDSQTALAGSYVLMNDLTLDNWTPIGGHDDKDGQGFSGIFDGNGHTITITGFNSSFDNTKIGLFGLIEKEGVVKNLCVAGDISYSSDKSYLYIGGIAGVNFGTITCCISRMTVEGIIQIDDKKLKGLSGFKNGASGGLIVGVNRGTTTNCYSTGSILISGNVVDILAGGIAGENGIIVGGGMSVTIGPGGTGGISAYQPNVKVSDVISHCYSTASVLSRLVVTGKTKSVMRAYSGGIVAITRTTGSTSSCVSLNKTIEADGLPNQSYAMPITLMHYMGFLSFYSKDIVIRRYAMGKEQKPKKVSDKNAVAFSDTQEHSWWLYPEGLTEKQRKQTFSFYFGDNEKAPWKWNDVEKRPVLYWEKDN